MTHLLQLSESVSVHHDTIYLKKQHFYSAVLSGEFGFSFYFLTFCFQ